MILDIDAIYAIQDIIYLIINALHAQLGVKLVQIQVFAQHAILAMNYIIILIPLLQPVKFNFIFILIYLKTTSTSTSTTSHCSSYTTGGMYNKFYI